MLRAVLGELVQTTAGKWITHPPTLTAGGFAIAWDSNKMTAVGDFAGP